MNGSLDSAGVQTLPLVSTGAVAVVPLPVEAEAKASPHPTPLPQAGEGADLPHPTQPRQADDLLPLPLAGEGWGEGRTEAVANAAATTADEAATTQPTTTATVAQPAAFAQPQSGAGMVGTTVLTLLLVIGFILLLAWFAKRMPGLGGTGNPSLKIVGSLPLGPRERVVVVAVGDTQLLLSTGPNGTRALHTLEQPLPMPSATPSPFAQVLAQQFGKKKS